MIVIFLKSFMPLNAMRSFYTKQPFLFSTIYKNNRQDIETESCTSKVDYRLISMDCIAIF